MLGIVLEPSNAPLPRPPIAQQPRLAVPRGVVERAEGIVRFKRSAPVEQSVDEGDRVPHPALVKVCYDLVQRSWGYFAAHGFYPVLGAKTWMM